DRSAGGSGEHQVAGAGGVGRGAGRNVSARAAEGDPQGAGGRGRGGGGGRAAEAVRGARAPRGRQEGGRAGAPAARAGESRFHGSAGDPYLPRNHGGAALEQAGRRVARPEAGGGNPRAGPLRPK